jgi:hypothetical protein
MESSSINATKSEWVPLGNNLECPFCGVPTHVNFEVLGAPIGDPIYTNETVNAIFCGFEKILKALPDLHHSQSATMLLRYCFSFCKAVYIMRTVPPPLYDGAAEGFDKRIKACFDAILGTTLNPNAWIQAQLSPSLSGFGLRSVIEHAPGAYLASIHNNNHILETTSGSLAPHLSSAEGRLQKYVGYKPNLDWKESDYSKFIDENNFQKLENLITPSDSKRLHSCRAPHAIAWLYAPPCRAQGLYFSDAQFRITCLRWLGEHVTTCDSLCLTCNTNLSPKASHTTRCRHGPGMIARHNALRDVLYNLASTACLAPIREKGGILGDAPGRRPGDIFIPAWHTSSLAIDLAVTCPLQNKYKNTDNAADHYAKHVKHADYDSGFIDTNIDFCAAVVDSYGSWSGEGLDVVSEIINRGAKRLLTDPHRYTATAWQQLSCVLQIHNSGMVLSRTVPPDSTIT